MPGVGEDDDLANEADKLRLQTWAAEDHRYYWDELQDDLRYLTVHEAMGRIVAELPAIGKNQRNKEQGFNFRGIDDVLNALNPLLAKYGVYYVPDVIDRVAAQRSTKSGGIMYEVNLHVRFTFYGPAGDSVQASGWGEGTDMGDKATNKATTGAMKYVLFQVFAIATEEASQLDSDRTSAEETRLPEPAPKMTERQVVSILDRLRPLLGEDDEGKLVYPDAWRAARAEGGPGTVSLETLEAMATGDRPMLPETYAARMAEILDQLGAESPGEPTEADLGPCVLCGRTRTHRVLVDGEVRCENATACRKHVQEHGEFEAAQPEAAATESEDRQ